MILSVIILAWMWQLRTPGKPDGILGFGAGIWTIHLLDAIAAGDVWF
jgi:hypothetical protein